jgi:hypothetical protein
MTDLRFTGEWPPQSLWSKYPNWEYALDEEDEPGQDETTLRPSENQSNIDDDVAFEGAHDMSGGIGKSRSSSLMFSKRSPSGSLIA